MEVLATAKENVPIDAEQEGTGVVVVVTVAVPEQAAVPLERRAEVGFVVALTPPVVIESGAPPAIVLSAVKVTVAVAPEEPLLKSVSVHVWPVVPVMLPL
jgi:hypothetical protein